jgi:hypothetical protein
LTITQHLPLSGFRKTGEVEETPVQDLRKEAYE